MLREERADREPAKTALVLCGGGSRGAVEAGFYLALEELGIRIDLIVGSSIGALNGALIASGMRAQELIQYWSRLRRSDLGVLSLSSLVHGLGADGLLSARVFRRHLARVVPVRRFEELKIPLIIIATDLKSGAPVELRSGDLHEAIQASCAVPGLFPPVASEGRQLVDGALAKNVPVDVALREEATTVLAMLCRCCPELKAPARGLIRVLAQSFAIAMDRAQRAGLEQYAGHPGVIILAPDLAPEIGTLEFRASGRLVEEAYGYARRRLPALLEKPAERAKGAHRAVDLKVSEHAKTSAL